MITLGLIMFFGAVAALAIGATTENKTVKAIAYVAYGLFMLGLLLIAFS